jgi:hypothetical protein
MLVIFIERKEEKWLARSHRKMGGRNNYSGVCTLFWMPFNCFNSFQESLARLFLTKTFMKENNISAVYYTLDTP